MGSVETKPLAGRVAIVTGGTRGLGLEIARAYTDAGARGCSQRPRRRRRRRTREACAALVERAGPVTVLVNNAGVLGPAGPLETNDWDAWVETIRINLLGTVLMCRAVLPGMRERGYGKIINLSGGGATGPRPNFSAYAASKAAVVRFTETLAGELDGIDVNAIAPGALPTRMLDEVLASGLERVEPTGVRARDRARGVPRLGGQRRHQRPPDRRAVGRLGDAPSAASGRPLHAAEDRP